MNRIWILCIVVFFGCQIDKNKTVDREKFTFKTGDDTELFFKNVRQLYYDMEENEAAKFHLFRLKQRVESDSLPTLNLAIVVNYLQDESYIFLEPNEILQQYDPLEINWTDSAGNSGTYKSGLMTREFMLEMASRIYEGIEQNYTFTLSGGSPILSTIEEREAFRVTMSDYYRLTRVF